MSSRLHFPVFRWLVEKYLRHIVLLIQHIAVLICCGNPWELFRIHHCSTFPNCQGESGTVCALSIFRCRFVCFNCWNNSWTTMWKTRRRFGISTSLLLLPLLVFSFGTIILYELISYKFTQAKLGLYSRSTGIWVQYSTFAVAFVVAPVAMSPKISKTNIFMVLVFAFIYVHRG